MKKIALGFILFLAALASCSSSKVNVPEDATSMEIVQMAQDAYDLGFTNKAIAYYNVLIQRYGMNTATYIEGKYEIAHIYVKKKKYDKAEPILNEIIEIYDTSPYGSLPGSFRKMVTNDLKKIHGE